MLSLQPSIKTGRNVWNSEALPKREFQNRLERLRAQMSAQGLDLLLIYGRAFSGKADPCYLSNFVTRLAAGAALAVPLQNAPTVFFEGATRGLPSMRLTTWIEDVRAGNDIATHWTKYLQKEGAEAKSVGLVGVRPQMPFQQYRTLQAALTEKQVTESDDLIAKLRCVKSERELGRLRAAGVAVSAMLDWLVGPKRQMTERALDAGARLAARLRGAEDVRLMIGRPGSSGFGLKLADDSAIRQGDRVIVYAAAEVDRYWAEAARTFVGTANGLAVLEPGTTKPVYDAMLKAAVAGQKTNAPVLAVRSAAVVAGITLAEQYGFGNGIGLSADEAPAIGDTAAGEFAAGMTLSLRLATGGASPLMQGDAVIVKANGNEIITRK
jgi:Xaa-Pro aminopeptidase